MTLVLDGSAGLTLTIWTTATRPSNPANGQLGFNSNNNSLEVYFSSGGWQNIVTGTYSINYVLIGGGGGSSGGTASVNYGSGGGAGTYVAGFASVTPGAAYTVVVGAGGTGVNQGTPGNATPSSITGGNTISASAAIGIGPSSTSLVGGNNAVYSGLSIAGGASGGTGAGSGGNANTTSGGPGATVTITGTSQILGGGGGTANSTSNIPGGPGGGGNGYNGAAGSNGTINTGSGGGGTSTVYTGGNGGSGIVFISYANPTQRAGGGTVSSYTSSNTTYWVHTFTTSGTFSA